MPPPLEDTAVVIRGGLLALVPTRNSIETCRARWGFYGLSFFGDTGLSVEEICQLAGLTRLPHPQIRVSTGEKMRAVGFDPYFSGEYPHLTVRFEISPTDDDLERLGAVFDQPVPNPLKLD